MLQNRQVLIHLYGLNRTEPNRTPITACTLDPLNDETWTDGAQAGRASAEAMLVLLLLPLLWSVVAEASAVLCYRRGGGIGVYSVVDPHLRFMNSTADYCMDRCVLAYSRCTFRNSNHTRDRTTVRYCTASIIASSSGSSITPRWRRRRRLEAKTRSIFFFVQVLVI